MVIANDAVNFSVGANLMLVLVAAQEQEWDEVHMAVKQFQNVNLALKYGPSRGGGAARHGTRRRMRDRSATARIQAAAEAYIGLVETGVGLIPGGGGSKEMLIRANERAASGRILICSRAATIFETVAMAKVGTSAEESRELGFLRREDGVSMNRESWWRMRRKWR